MRPTSQTSLDDEKNAVILTHSQSNSASGYEIKELRIRRFQSKKERTHPLEVCNVLFQTMSDHYHGTGALSLLKYKVPTCKVGAYDAAKTMSELRSRPVMKAASPAEPMKYTPAVNIVKGMIYVCDLLPCISGKLNRPSAGVPKRSLALVEMAAYSPFSIKERHMSSINRARQKITSPQSTLCRCAQTRRR